MPLSCMRASSATPNGLLLPLLAADRLLGADFLVTAVVLRATVKLLPEGSPEPVQAHPAHSSRSARAPCEPEGRPCPPTRCACRSCVAPVRRSARRRRTSH